MICKQTLCSVYFLFLPKPEPDYAYKRYANKKTCICLHTNNFYKVTFLYIFDIYSGGGA